MFLHSLRRVSFTWNVDHAVDCACQGRLALHRYELGIQLFGGRDDTDTTRKDRMASIPNARLLLRMQFCCW